VLRVPAAGRRGRARTDWPTAECREFARLISRFADDIDQHPADLGCLA
jgi:hypothetical protein